MGEMLQVKEAILSKFRALIGHIFVQNLELGGDVTMRFGINLCNFEETDHIAAVQFAHCCLLGPMIGTTVVESGSAGHKKELDWKSRMTESGGSSAWSWGVWCREFIGNS